MPASSGPNADAAAQTETATASCSVTDEWIAAVADSSASALSPRSGVGWWVGID